MNNEHEVESQLIKGVVNNLQGITRKFTSPGYHSVPDRIIMLPNGVEWKIEVKTIGKNPNPAQYRELLKYLKLKVSCGWVNGFAGTSGFIKFCSENKMDYSNGVFWHGDCILPNSLGILKIESILSKTDI